MLHRIKELEVLARQLEPTSSQRDTLLGHVGAHAQHFLDTLPSIPTYVDHPDKGRALYESPISEEGIAIEEALGLLKANVDTLGVNPASARFMGYISGGGLYYAALADYLAAVTNRYAGIFFASPGAVRMENMLLRWMAQVIGYPTTAAGNLTSGGSIANLIGVVTAREKYGIEGPDVPRAVVYMTRQLHHSVSKALRVAGLGSCVTRFIAVDDAYRMDVQALEKAILADQKEGLRPWLIVASAGTINTGTVDPLVAIGELAAAHHLWLHVDGAYGALYALCDEGRRVLQGMERSDSISMDPHKTLFLPYGSGAVLVKERQHLYNAHHDHADYLQDTLGAIEELSPADLSPELSKHFRGLRLWLPLKLLGVAPFRAAVEEKMLLTRYFYERLQNTPGFEVGPYPDLTIATYRYLPKRGDPNEFNQRLLNEMMKDGRIFISSTLLNGQFTLRAAIGVFRTHVDEVELALEVLKEKAAALENE